MHDVTVVKVGGSLFDWPELGQRLGQWLETLSATTVLLIPGGGPVVKFIRNVDRWHHLGEESAHWLALHALSVNAHLLTTILIPFCSSKPVVITDLQETDAIWAHHRVPILDPFPFALQDEDQTDHLPHSWSVTSDSLAARVAACIRAGKLFLLKSTDIPNDWMDSNEGIVDPYFETAVRSAHSMNEPLSVSAVNLRKWRGSGSEPGA
jgi:aspartokinase-like uncharacterized kinase